MPEAQTVAAALSWGEQQLAAAGINSSRLDAGLLMAEATGRRREWLLAHSETKLAATALKQFQNYVGMRASRRSLATVIGKREFYGLELVVSGEVLVPRAETEKIVELAIAQAPPGGRLIDIGTGCGAIAIAIARHRPDLSVSASELSASALAVARQNAHRHRTDISWYQGDLFERLTGQYEVITANLPYLSRDQAGQLMPEAAADPAIALFGGDGDGLDLYRRFFSGLGAFIATDGLVFIESDPWQQGELKKLGAKAGLTLINEDYFVLGFKAGPARPPA